MTFNDIFKSSFLDNISSISILDMVLALVLAFGLGLFIFFVYKYCKHRRSDSLFRCPQFRSQLRQLHRFHDS